MFLDTTKKEWLKKAEKDGMYAVAFALLDISDSLDRLGLYNNSLAGNKTMGTTEKIAVVLEEQLHEIAAALYQLQNMEN